MIDNEINNHPKINTQWYKDISALEYYLSKISQFLFQNQTMRKEKNWP